jgi:hypothetical protein
MARYIGRCPPNDGMGCPFISSLFGDLFIPRIFVDTPRIPAVFGVLAGLFGHDLGVHPKRYIPYFFRPSLYFYDGRSFGHMFFMAPP